MKKQYFKPRKKRRLTPHQVEKAQVKIRALKQYIYAFEHKN